MSIIDRRANGAGKSAPNRKKFIDRYKKQIKDSVEKAIAGRNMKDAAKDTEVEIDRHSTQEPTYQIDPSTGKKTRVYAGNDRFSKGHREDKPEGGEGQGNQASNSGDGEDAFTFQLTKEEFYDIYFEGMELPNFVKESLVGANKFKLKRSGFTRFGNPSRLNGKKTMEQAIARRIAAKAQGKERPPYLDDVDVRFDNIIQKPYPITKALMFCIMDVSGSMDEPDKTISKKFFMLLYLFLTKCYTEVEVRFIKHTEEAHEVDEQTFFYDRSTGGTIVSTAFTLMKKIMEEEVNLESTNVYVAQASDGDNWPNDNALLVKTLTESILPNVQYMAYIQTRNQQKYSWSSRIPDLLKTYSTIGDEKLNCKLVQNEKDVYPVLRELFERVV